MATVSFVANILGVLLVFGTLGGAMILGGNWISVLADGCLVAREKFRRGVAGQTIALWLWGEKVLPGEGARER